MHCACSARAAIANQLGSGQPKMLAQSAQQRDARLDREPGNLTVDLQFDWFGGRPETFDDSGGQRFLIRLRGWNSHQARCGGDCASALDEGSTAD